MMHLVTTVGGNPQTAFGPAGLGDLVATSQSANSTNYTTGIRFAQSLKPVRGSEALNTIPCIVNIPGIVLSDLPFIQSIYHVVVEKKPAHEAFLATLLALCPQSD